jgi:Mrp family chromosome partitioning ATPase
MLGFFRSSTIFFGVLCLLLAGGIFSLISNLLSNVLSNQLDSWGTWAKEHKLETAALAVGSGVCGTLIGYFIVWVWNQVGAKSSFFAKKISNQEDLKSFNMRLLGKLPRVPRRRGDSRLQAVLDLLQDDAVAFLRANLNVLLQKVSGPKIILVTSLLRSEGKSIVTATLADSFAAAGQRTLIVDADLHSAGQSEIWANLTQSNAWVSLHSDRYRVMGIERNQVTTDGDVRQYNLRTATRDPENAKARKLQDKLHFLPAGPATWRSSEFLSNGSFAAALKRWGTSYDVILIDSPPLLAVVDTIMLAPLSTGMLLVLEPGRNTHETMQQMLDSFLVTPPNILGVVFNKIRLRRSVYNYYPPILNRKY